MLFRENAFVKLKRAVLQKVTIAIQTTVRHRQSVENDTHDSNFLIKND